jgi:hypothetical protein
MVMKDTVVDKSRFVKTANFACCYPLRTKVSEFLYTQGPATATGPCVYSFMYAYNFFE